ncbi:branched-chain alpha-ketoacid dehydrogenase [Syncephalastrum racemosum]|uniref:Protein-serine/threonine kinase n=1 Tax=Syncephalastrum racemosum TaxID=13706 RepID=A0A1X2H7B3_SYNRA|nr:branched-chain alpha-ketoacid dehydrogenase [Syncephalastrum racemosum]
MTDDRLVKSANWVRDELLVRLAHRIRDFQQLPFFVGTNPHIEFIYRLYWGAFEKLRKSPAIKDLDDNDHFCKVLHDLLDDGQLVVPRLALGVTECAAHYNGSQELDRFVNRMLRSRISRRVLAEQHLALTDAYEHGWDIMGEGDGYVGIIFVRCSASDLIKRATDLVNRHAKTVYYPTYCKDIDSSTSWQPPAIEVAIHHDVQGRQQTEKLDEIVFAYVPEHLEYILFELLSNAIRFTMAKHTPSNYPPIQLCVSANETDVFFRVSDQGGGIPQDRYPHLWSYQARAPSGDFLNFQQIEKMPTNIQERATQAADLGHVRLGMGLPMSRVYAEYWGGELQVMTLEGYGTDAYVRIPRLGTKAENLGFEQHVNHGMAEDSSPHRYHQSLVPQPIPGMKYPSSGDGWSKSCMVRS